MESLVILPAYNVSKSLTKLLDDLEAYKKYVLFVDDGSKDDTAKLICQRNYSIIQHKQNCGIARAVLSGIEYANDHGYNKVILMDADGQHSPKHIFEIDNKLNKSECVFCSRFHKDTNATSLKWNSNIFAAIIVNEIWGTNFTDISCGFKGFHISKMLLDLIGKSNGYELIFDVFFYALQNRKKIDTVNIDAIYDYSEFQSTRGVEILAFIDSIKKHINSSLFNADLIEVEKKIMLNQNFHIKIRNIDFWGFYIKYENTYIIQCNPEDIAKYLVSIGDDNND